MNAPTIETPRLRLRPWQPTDRDAWAALTGDPRVMEFFPATLDRATALAQADRLAARLLVDGYGFWIVEIKDGPPFAGILALIDVPFEAHFTPALEIGWRFAVDAWGKGYATEGARALLTFAFESLDRAEVVAMTATINVRSRRVMERLGMSYDAADDFDHPRIAAESPLSAHVLYRIRRER